MINTAGFVSIGVATFGLALACAVYALWVVAAIAIVVGLIWAIGQWYNVAWAAPIGFAVFVVLIAYGVWANVPASWMLGNMIAALAAWDLQIFRNSLQEVERIDAAGGLVRVHLLRVLIVAGLSLLLGALGLSIVLDIGMTWIMLIGILAALGLSQTLKFLRGLER